MGILDTVLGAANGGAVGQLAQQFGLSPGQATSAVGALMPHLANGIQNNAATKEGLSGLLSALGSGQHESYLDDPATLAQQATTDDGNAILGHVLGSKDASRQVAGQAAAQTGIDPAILKKMLPVVATLAMGALARHSKAAAGGGTPGGAGLGALLGGLLGGQAGGASGGGAGGGGGMLGSVLGGLLGGR